MESGLDSYRQGSDVYGFRVEDAIFKTFFVAESRNFAVKEVVFTLFNEFFLSTPNFASKKAMCPLFNEFFLRSLNFAVKERMCTIFNS